MLFQCFNQFFKHTNTNVVFQQHYKTYTNTSAHPVKFSWGGGLAHKYRMVIGNGLRHFKCIQNNGKTKYSTLECLMFSSFQTTLEVTSLLLQEVLMVAFLSLSACFYSNCLRVEYGISSFHHVQLKSTTLSYGNVIESCINYFLITTKHVIKLYIFIYLPHPFSHLVKSITSILMKFINLK